MRVFISWSGERSRAVAEALRWWLPKVIQAIQPWMSANDIDKGTRWRAGLSNELEQSSIGIICLTPENLTSTWIHFEAGALSKQQQNTYVCTFLYGLEPADIRDPLAQFQSTKSQMEEVRKLIHTINNVLGESKLSESEINESFDVWWPKLEERLSVIPATESSPEPQRDIREILNDILNLVRAQSRITETRASESKLTPRFPSTLNWSPEDAQIIYDHYQSYPDMLKPFIEYLKTDESKAKLVLEGLKNRPQVSGQIQVVGKPRGKSKNPRRKINGKGSNENTDS